MIKRLVARMMQAFLLSFTLVSLSSAAYARIELKSDSIMYVDLAGSDAPGCGTAPGAHACATAQYLYGELVDNYDLRGKRLKVKFGPGVHTAPLQPSGMIPGTKTKMQPAPTAGIPLADITQIIFEGDVANPSNVVLRPTTGAAFLPINGAVG